MKHYRTILIALALMMLTCLGAVYTAQATPAGGPVYKLEWLDAFHEGTSITLPKILTPDRLDLMPNRNFATVSRLKLTFSFSGEETATVPANTVEIRLPYSLYRNATGGSAEYSRVVPLPRDTSFNYRIDTATNEIVIYNFTPIDEALIFTVQIDYKVTPSNVWLPSVPGQTIAPYENSVKAKVKISRPGQPVMEDTTNTIEYSYITNSKLSSLSKIGSASYSAWSSSWGEAPADAADYIYVQWRIYCSYASTCTQPFNVSLHDLPGQGEGGQVVGWSFPSGGFVRANAADGWDNNLDEFNSAAAAAARITSPHVNGSSFYTYLTMRYPRSMLIQDPTNPNRKYMTVNNQVTATLVGDYGATDTRLAKANAYTYAENSWTPPEGAGDMYKDRISSPAYGMIDRLENAWKAGSIEAIPLHYSSYDWTVRSAQQQWKRTMDAAGNYGVVEWTLTHTDNSFSFDTYSKTSPQYYPLGAGDYKLTSLILYKPVEWVYGEPDAFGNNTLIAQDSAKYGTVTTQVTTKVNPGPGDWITLGVSTANPPSAYSWTFTPADGSPAKTQTSSLTLDLTQMVPGQDVLGVRFIQTSKSAKTQQQYNLKMALYPNDYVITGLRPWTNAGRTGDIRNSVYLYNEASSQASGGSISRVDTYYVRNLIQLNRYTTYSSYSKSMSTITENLALMAYRMPVTLYAYDYAYVTYGSTLAQAIATGMVREQTEGIFYDLLPIGTVLDPSSVRVSGYGISFTGSTSVEIIDNFRNTGRSLLIVRVAKPEGVSNYSLSGSTLRSGFTLSFTLLNSYTNLLDNPRSGRNYSAYESTVGPLGSGVADLPPATSFTEQAAITAFTNVNGKDEPDSKRFMHGVADWSINPPLAAELGYDKKVRSPEDIIYSKETVAQGGGQYFYRLRLGNREKTSSFNIVFYDSLEDRMPAGTPYWQGTLESIDLSHPRASWGIEPVVYYATRTVNPKDVTNDRLVVGGTVNTALWKPLNLSAPYPADLKSIAVDMRFNPDGTDFVLPPEKSLVVGLTMRAPGDVSDYVDPIDYAYNSTFLSAQTIVDGISSALAVVDVTPTKVSLKPVTLDVTKSSYPTTGTQAVPAIVFTNNTVTYTVGVKNTNIAETIPGVVLEDDIPDGLLIDAGNIRCRFGTSGSFRPLSETGRVVLNQSGQKLSFQIDKLAAGEQVSFQIPATVQAPTQPGRVRFENTAVVTSAFGYDQQISSPTTYHEMPVVSVPLSANKVLNAGGRLPKAGEFQLELLDSALNRVGGPYGNSGDAPYGFIIPELAFGTTGTFNYYLREVVPQTPETGMSYAAAQYYISVRVTYNTTTRSLVASPVIRLGGALHPLNQPMSFVNTYKANGVFTPSIPKQVKNTIFEQGWYDNKFTATLVGPCGRTVEATNQGGGTEAGGNKDEPGRFTFSPFAYEEKDIGKEFVFTITENPGTQDSMKYDDRTIELRMTVVDQGNGVLDFVTSYWHNDMELTQDEAHFVNEFQRTSHEVTKIWTVPAGTTTPLPDPLPEITLQLYRDGVAYGLPYGAYTSVKAEKKSEEILETDANGKAMKVRAVYLWPSIPKFKPGGSSELSVYTVKEVHPPTQYQVEMGADGSTITNTYRDGIFTASKAWSGLSEDPAGDYKVIFQLFQTVKGDNSWSRHICDAILDGKADDADTPINGTPVGNISYREISPWVVQWSGLPASGLDPRVPPGDNVNFEYRVSESSVLHNGSEVLGTFVVEPTTNTHVTNHYSKTSFTATKVWLNGPKTGLPEVTFKLWQSDAAMNPEIIATLDGEKDLVATPAYDGITWQEIAPWVVQWKGLPRYKPGTMDEYAYSFRENPTPGLANYEQIYAGEPVDLVYNSYIPPKINVKATKNWVGGTDEGREPTELMLYRFYTAGVDGNGNPYPALEPRPVPVTPVINPASGSADTYTYTWQGVEKTTLSGIPYEFSLHETGETGNKIQIGNDLYNVTYEGDHLNGYKVTNTYQVFRRDSIVTKAWDGGPAADHGEVGITAYYQSSVMPEPLLLVDEHGNRDTWDKVEILPETGFQLYTWFDIARTDPDGRPYVFTVTEDGTDENGINTINGNRYKVDIESFHITNTFIQDTGPVTATKEWLGGPADNKSRVKLSLWRQTADMASPEEVLEEPVITGDDPFTYTWDEQKLEDESGQAYTFTVREAGVVDDILTLGAAEGVPGDRYLVRMEHISPTHIKVINDYQIPLGSVKAAKTWTGGPRADNIAAILDLYRQTDAMPAPELVNVPYTASFPEAAYWHIAYLWEGLELTDKDGLPYTFSVMEREAVGGIYTSAAGNSYAVAIDGLHVGNQYIQPRADFTATKTWRGGPEADHTAVKLILRRQTTAISEPETVRDPDVVSAEAPFLYKWLALPTHALDGLPYAYAIAEEGETDGKALINGNTYQVSYTKLDSTTFAVINTYMAPQPCTVKPEAKKHLAGGSLVQGQFTFLLTDHKGREYEVSNRADGTIKLPEIRLTEPGEYAFTLMEKAGSVKGMRYDASVYKLTLTVVINSRNQLEIASQAWTRDGEPYAADVPIFQNTQDPPVDPVDPVDPSVPYPTLHVPLQAKKVLTNGRLKGGEFTFQLKDKTGKVITEVQNAADGTVTFPDRTFGYEISNYTLTINEAPGTDKNITYDNTVYTLSYTTRAVEGKLKASVTVLKNGIPYAGDIVFTNERRMPPTGDRMPRLFTILAVLGLAGILIVLPLNMRKKRNT